MKMRNALMLTAALAAAELNGACGGSSSVDSQPLTEAERASVSSLMESPTIILDCAGVTAVSLPEGAPLEQAIAEHPLLSQPAQYPATVGRAVLALKRFYFVPAEGEVWLPQDCSETVMSFGDTYEKGLSPDPISKAGGTLIGFSSPDGMSAMLIIRDTGDLPKEYDATKQS